MTKEEINIELQKIFDSYNNYNKLGSNEYYMFLNNTAKILKNLVDHRIITDYLIQPLEGKISYTLRSEIVEYSDRGSKYWRNKKLERII
jgi:hypothetical protein